MKKPLIAAMCAALLAGCGGGGSSPLQPGGGAQAQGANATAGATIVSTIVVPAASQAAQSDRRGAQYVSPSTLGLKVTVTDVPPTGGSASFTATTTVYTLATGTNQVVVPTPATAGGHTEDITYVSYNLAPVANAIPSAAKALGYALATGLVIAPGQNTNNVALSGVVDSFPVPLAEGGSFGMMSASPPTLAGARASLGFGGAASPSGVATLLDAGGSNIATTNGGPWNVVGSVPTTATTAATGVPVTIAETAGTCGAVGTGPHLKLSFAGSTPATTAAISTTNGALSLNYDGKGGAGWYATVTAKAQSQSLVYTLSSLAVTSGSSEYSCASQSLAFNASNDPAVLMTIVQHAAALPYTLTVPASCSPFVNVYAGNSTAAGNLVPAGSPTSLGVLTQFTIQEVTPGSTACTIAIQDANAASTGGAAFPGGTTYVAALPPGYTQQIVVP